MRTAFEELNDLLHEIEQTPGYFMNYPSVIRLRYFILGWAYENETRQNIPTLFLEFRKWLLNRFELPVGNSWDDTLIFLSGGSEEQAFHLFFKVFSEFKREIEESTSTRKK